MAGRHATTSPAAVPAFTTRRTRPRVVVEDRDLVSRRTLERRLRAEGYDVVGCCGPESLSRRRCPLEEGGTCAAIAEADVVVTALRSDTDRQPRVLAGIREQHPDLPVVVRAPAPVAHRLRDLLDGCSVQGPADDVAAEVAATLDARGSH